VNTLTDVFDGQPPTQATPVVVPPVDPEEVDRNYRAMLDRVARAEQVEVARQNAATARAAIQCFDNYSRAFRKVAQTKGSPVDHFVDLDLADYCDAQVATLSRLLDGSL
jgi:hypothetical protein